MVTRAEKKKVVEAHDGQREGAADLGLSSLREIGWTRRIRN